MSEAVANDGEGRDLGEKDSSPPRNWFKCMLLL